MKYTQEQKDRFWNKVDIGDIDECWEWKAYKMPNTGYGRLCVNYDYWLAHRFAWTIVNGNIPETDSYHGTVVMHTCDNPACVNVNHLKLGTQKENMIDAKQKGRKWAGENKGENNNRAKLTEKKVRKIKKVKYNDSANDLAQEHGVDVSQIYCIWQGKTWSHVKIK